MQNANPDEIDYSRDGTNEKRYKIEAEDYRFYWKSEWDSVPPDWLGEENPEWHGNYAVKYWYKEWKDIIFQYLDTVISQGFMGVYLDKIDDKICNGNCRVLQTKG